MKAVVNLVQKVHHLFIEKPSLIGVLLSKYVPGGTQRYEECSTTDIVVSVTTKTTSDALNVIITNLGGSF